MRDLEQRLYNQPLVSICISTYNAEKTVVQTVRSILDQKCYNMEIHVDNDYMDNPLALLQEFQKVNPEDWGLR